MVAERCSAQRAHVLAQTGRPAAGQELERDGRKREHICGCVPGLPGDALGRAVRTPHGRALPDTLEGIDDAKTGGSGFVGRHEDVTRMQGAVPDARFAREVDG